MCSFPSKQVQGPGVSPGPSIPTGQAQRPATEVSFIAGPPGWEVWGSDPCSACAYVSFTHAQAERILQDIRSYYLNNIQDFQGDNNCPYATGAFRIWALKQGWPNIPVNSVDGVIVSAEHEPVVRQSGIPVQSVRIYAEVEWKFNDALFLWEKVRDMPSKAFVWGASHTVATVLIGGNVWLIDWATAQFGRIPPSARFYSAKVVQPA